MVWRNGFVRGKESERKGKKRGFSSRNSSCSLILLPISSGISLLLPSLNSKAFSFKPAFISFTKCQLLIPLMEEKIPFSSYQYSKHKSSFHWSFISTPSPETLFQKIHPKTAYPHRSHRLRSRRKLKPQRIHHRIWAFQNLNLPYPNSKPSFIITSK